MRLKESWLSPLRVGFVVLYLVLLPGGRAHGSRPSRSAQAALPLSLEALVGEYTDPSEPDTPVSFYLQNGKLIIENEREIPLELKQIAATQFAVPGTKVTVHFMMDESGRPESATISDEPQAVFQRTGEAVHHVFHDYKRTEAMIPMRDGIKLHAVILETGRH